MLWENRVPDELVARMARRLEQVDPDFPSVPFRYRAYAG